MSEQSRLFDFDPQPTRPARTARAGRRPNYSLFFAIIPDSRTARLITEISEAFVVEKGLEGNLLEAHRLHVTLHPVVAADALPSKVIEAAKQVGSSIVASEFDVRFDRALVYSSSRAFVLAADQGAAEIWKFHTQLGIALANAGFSVSKNFNPHMTFMYGNYAAAQYPIPPIEWTAKEFTLICSHNGKHVHEYVGRWPLRN